MFYIGFFVGWVIGILSALLFLYIIRRETESEASKPAIRWHIVATEGDPPKMGRYFTIREDRTGMWVADSYYGKKSWYKGLKVVAWISRQEMLEAGLDVLAKVKK